jgi:hypothetical protein
MPSIKIPGSLWPYLVSMFTASLLSIASVSFAQSQAPLGPPSAVRFNGIETQLDASHRVAKHAVRAKYDRLLAASAIAEIPDIRVLGRRDSLIVYVPNVAGAADYRVRVMYYVQRGDDYIAFEPGPAMWACAGFRQHAWRAKEDANGIAARELLQSIELPGLTRKGQYYIEVEALGVPCPYTGMPAHTSATIAMALPVLQGLTGGTIPFTGFADAIATYGSEYVNGQLPNSDWFIQAGQKRGQAFPPTPSYMSALASPVARATLKIKMPFADEVENAPIIDVGANSTFDDFAEDGIASSFTHIANRNFGGSDSVEGPFKNWYYWTHSTQAATSQTTDASPVLGVQIWQRHGRLNITAADWAQDVFADVHFSSLKSGVQTLDNERYVHSFFRVDSGATARRYWHWMMCGAANATTLIDPATNIPRVRHVLRPAFYDYGGVNPTAPWFNDVPSASNNRECIQLLQLAASNPNLPTLADGSSGPAPNQTLLAVINPEGSEQGVINLTPALFDRGYGTVTWNWRLDADDKYAGPIVEPFDQAQPLTHYDVFVRPDRMVLFANGRQEACWNFAARPLVMNVGHIVYGQVLYHTDAETGEYYYPRRTVEVPYRAPMGNFNTTFNNVAADYRAWDAVGHAEKLEIPALFNFNPALCKQPGSLVAR